MPSCHVIGVTSPSIYVNKAGGINLMGLNVSADSADVISLGASLLTRKGFHLTLVLVEEKL